MASQKSQDYARHKVQGSRQGDGDTHAEIGVVKLEQFGPRMNGCISFSALRGFHITLHAFDVEKKVIRPRDRCKAVAVQYEWRCVNELR